MRKPIKILIADDHKVVASGLETLLDAYDELSVVGNVSDGQHLIEFVRSQEVDIILMDISMPVMDGLEATKRVHREFPWIKILALTTHDDGSLVNAILRAGASGYILKTASSNELRDGVMRVMKGEKVLSTHLTSSLLEHIHASDKATELQAKVTRREREIIRLIAKEFTTQQIANTLFISTNTVTTHKRNLFAKFDVKNSVGLVRKAIDLGLVDKE